jgi:hypothetical protein
MSTQQLKDLLGDEAGVITATKIDYLPSIGDDNLERSFRHTKSAVFYEEIYAQSHW